MLNKQQRIYIYKIKIFPHKLIFIFFKVWTDKYEFDKRTPWVKEFKTTFNSLFEAQFVPACPPEWVTKKQSITSESMKIQPDLRSWGGHFKPCSRKIVTRNLRQNKTKGKQNMRNYLLTMKIHHSEHHEHHSETLPLIPLTHFTS